MMDTSVGVSGFTSIAAREAFESAYAAAFERLWAAPFRAEKYSTRFGIVQAYRCGPRGRKPVVLVGGPCGFAVAWYKNSRSLSLDRELIALDPLGELGLSVQTAAIRTAEDAAAWLDEVLDAAGAQHAHLVGASSGAWSVLSHQLRTGQRAAALTLIEPPGLGPASGRFAAWLRARRAASALPDALRRRAGSLLRDGTLADPDLGRLARLGGGFRRRLPAPGGLPLEQLAAADIRATVLLGEHSPQYDSSAALVRLAAAAPCLRPEIVPGSGHALATERPDIVSAAVLRT